MQQTHKNFYYYLSYQLLALAFVSMFGVSCGNQQPSGNTISFRVNQDLLSDTVFTTSDEMLRLQPPQNWAQLSSNDTIYLVFAEVMQHKLEAVFIDTKTEASLLISEVSADEMLAMEQVFENPDLFYNSNNNWLSVQHGDFKYNSYQIDQIVLQNHDIVIYKLFASRMGKTYEINYSVPRAYAEQILRAVESSIGSIN